MHGSKRSNFGKRTFKFKIQLFVLMKNFTKQFVLIAQGILKLDDSQGKTLGGQIITYIRVRDVSWRLAHEAKASEVAWHALDLLILLWAEGVIAGKVKVIEGSTLSRHHLLELLIVPEAVLFFIVALAVVVLVRGGVELLPLGAVSDEVGGVAALQAAPRWSPLFLVKLMQRSELHRQ
jgi:hypothetical protein